MQMTAGTENEKGKKYSVLAMNTLAFTVNFAVWTMFSVIGIKIKDELGLNETEFGLLVATPILSIGSTGAAQVAMIIFVIFYATFILITWWWYRRDAAEVRYD